MPDAYSRDCVAGAISAYPLVGPVLDVGAGEFSSWFRPLFEAAGLEYLALDSTEHPGVDLVHEAGNGSLGRWFGTVLLLSVLEHVREPARIVDWSIRHLRCGGRLVVAVPYCWSYHAYPHDFWRFLPDGLQWLLRELDVVELRQSGERFDQPGQLFCVAVKR